MVVREPKALTALIEVNNEEKKTTITMNGSNVYNVTINGKTQRTSNDTFESNLVAGLNIIRVETDLDCQGYIEREIFISEDIHYYPNPTEKNINLHVGGKDDIIKVIIFTEKGDLVYNDYHNITEDSRKTQIDLSNQIVGKYIVILESKTVRKTFKVIRK